MAPGDGREGRAVIVGMGVTGRAASVALRSRGWDVVVVEDRPRPGLAEEVAAVGARLGTEADVDGAGLVVPSPGVPPHHPLLARAAAGAVPVLSEVELAWRWASSPSMVAVTGTNGKTTVTTLVAAMLVRSGRRAVAAGNIGLPLIEAVQRPVDVVVAEVSSFQLHWTEAFRPDVATWLNFAEDHLDWHPDLFHYAEAKARIWRQQGSGDVAVANADDPVVLEAATAARGRVVTFGSAAGADFRVERGAIWGPEGPVIPLDRLRRALPHDVANALASTATAMAAGAAAEACAAVLAEFAGLPHRVELVGEAGGVRWYDDSKATTPAAVLAAIQGFDSAVLIAGGRNKGLDLRVLSRAAPRLRGVVAIGESAGEIADAFEGSVPVVRAATMAAAVKAAAAAAEEGDAVLLSPACASQDWYTDYRERGEDFAREVRRLCG